MTIGKPFTEAASVRTVGGLSAENGTEELLVYGSLVLRRDRQSLRRAKELAAWFAEVAEAIGDEAGLPEAADESRPEVVTVKNPFA